MNDNAQKILIVEDDRAVALIERKKLEAAGFDIEVVEYGKTALQRLERDRFDLLLLDYQLPDMTASEIVEDLGEKIHSIPVIIITAQGDEQLAAKMFKCGVADYIVKDANLNYAKSLPKIVQNHIERFSTATRNRTLQNQLLKSEEMFRKTFEAIQDPSYIWEHLADGKIILANCNRVAKEFFNEKAPNIIGTELEDFYAINPGIISNIRHTFDSNETKHEDRSTKLSIAENERWLDIDYVKIKEGSILVIYKDITESKQTESALKESNEKFHSLVNSSQEGIIAYNKDIQYTLWNPAMERIFGTRSNDVLGREPFEIFRFINQVGEGDAFRSAVKGKSSIRSVMPYNIPENGKHGYFESSHFPLFDAQGNIVGGMAVIRDVTEQKMVEITLLENEIRLMRQNKAYRELAISETHEFENITTALNKITETTARALQIERAGIWLYNDDHSSVICKDLYEQSPNRHSEGMELGSTQYPKYFNALSEERTIAASNAHTDPKTMEFSESYLTPLGISSMLGAPIRVGNKMVGVICCEHSGPSRQWTTDEQNFAASMADFVSLSLETSARVQVEGELRKSKDDLEVRVKERTASLIESESKIRNIVENAAEGIITIDDHGIVDLFNPAAEQIFGYKADEMVGKNVSILMPQPYKDMHNDYINNYVRTGIKKVIGIGRETVGMRKDGTTFPLHISVSEIPSEGKNIFTGIVIDITDRKKSEEQIRQLSRAVEQSSSSVVITDTKGKIEYVNSRFTQKTGYTSEEAIGQNPSVLKSGEQGPEVYRELWETITSGREWRGEFHNKKKNGELYWELASISPIRNEKGVITHFLAVKEDITERKQSEARLKAAMEEAQRANDAKSVFLSSMSHELRTPMNSILGFAQLLESDPAEPLSQGQNENVEHILQSGNHLLGLINDVLDLSRIESGKFQISVEVVEIATVIDEAVSTVRPMAQKRKINVTNAIDVPDLYVKADYTRLKQVLINLLSNAIKYNNVDGSVTISCESLKAETIRISIQDTGDGISEDKLASLFDPFNRLGMEASDIEGSGIGLTIARRLMVQMKGNIGVQSEVGKGSNFHIDLKKAEAPSLETVNADIVMDTTTHLKSDKKYKMLYVEDNPANLKLIANIIKRRPNIELISFSLARPGIEHARAHHLDIILMDINLPEMNGFEALKLLKSYDETKEIPVVAISADAMPVDIEKGKTAGFIDYITKPVNINQFLQVLDNVLTTEATKVKMK